MINTLFCFLKKNQKPQVIYSKTFAALLCYQYSFAWPDSLRIINHLYELWSEW